EGGAARGSFPVALEPVIQTAHHGGGDGLAVSGDDRANESEGIRSHRYSNVGEAADGFRIDGREDRARSLVTFAGAWAEHGVREHCEAGLARSVGTGDRESAARFGYAEATDEALSRVERSARQLISIQG